MSENRERHSWSVVIGVSLDVGNIGNELTTITEVTLLLPDNHILKSQKRGQTLIVDDFETRVCERGVAFVDHREFFGRDQPEWKNVAEGIVVLKLLGGQEHRQKVTFEVEKGS